MQRIALTRSHSFTLPSLALVVALVLLALIALSIVVQPPRPDGVDGLRRALAWARATLFTVGAAAFLLALVAFLGSERSSQEDRQVPAGLSVRPMHPGRFTVVALGTNPHDPRAIADADNAARAVAVLKRWTVDHPEEHVVIYAPSGTPLAFRAPSSTSAVGR